MVRDMGLKWLLRGCARPAGPPVARTRQRRFSGRAALGLDPGAERKGEHVLTHTRGTHFGMNDRITSRPP
jgi:hypothetical protein